MNLCVILLNLTLFVGLISADDQQTRIVGGSPASVQQHPYQVSLRVRGQHFCGGSIISERHILTAGHCVEDYFRPPYTDVTIHSGTSDSTGSGHLHRVAGVKSHPGYRGKHSDLHHDIAIITLADSITFDGTQQKINLPSSDIRDGEMAVLTGWGFTDNVSNQTPANLQKANMRLVSGPRCKQQLGQIFDEQVCAVQVPSGGACSGDSGGPLAINGEVVGVASWIIPPCGSGNPDVFTKVYAYRSFIDSAMRGENTPSNPNLKPNPNPWYPQVNPNWNQQLKPDWSQQLNPNYYPQLNPNQQWGLWG